MELQELLEKFLPNYGLKKSLLIGYYKEKYRIEFEDAEIDNRLLAIHFKEIFQNFADKICKEQKVNCEKELMRYFAEIQDRGIGGLSMKYSSNTIINAKQPKITEL